MPEPASKLAVPAVPPRKPRLWLVDDSPVERKGVERTLGPGYEFEHFSDGSEVIERLERGGAMPDLMLLDWVMPGVSGDEVCKFVRSRPALAQVPIVFVTASRLETDDVVCGLGLGANDLIQRPYVADELRARVETQLRTKGLSDAADRERARLAAVNGLARSLFLVDSVEGVVERLADSLAGKLAHGCAVLLLPGEIPFAAVARHADPVAAQALAAISTVADPVVHAFPDRDSALRTLPPAYHGYIRDRDLRALAILPFPIRSPVQGVVTVTREGDVRAFDADDIATIETCIEYAGLAVQGLLRLESERLARGQLSAIIDHAPIGIVVSELDGRIALVNRPASAMIPGIDRTARLADVCALARWSTVDDTPIGPARWRFGAIPGTEVYLARDPAGAERWLRVATVATASQLISTIEDVTTAHAIAVERERVAAYQQQVIGIVGHDLRTPLNALVTGLGVLELHCGELPAIQPVIDRLRHSTTRMTSIIDHLLDVTRARLGSGIPVHRQPGSLASVLRNVVDEVALAHPDLRIELRADDPLQGAWDAGRMSQVFANLIGNAAQYGAPGAPVEVEARAVDRTAIVAVRNAVAGEPIPPDRLHDIFEPFRRGREGERRASGLGLGLYIASEIVRAHGGTITAASDATATVFTVRLPLAPP